MIENNENKIDESKEKMKNLKNKLLNVKEYLELYKKKSNKEFIIIALNKNIKNVIQETIIFLIIGYILYSISNNFNFMMFAEIVVFFNFLSTFVCSLASGPYFSKLIYSIDNDVNNYLKKIDDNNLDEEDETTIVNLIYFASQLKSQMDKIF